MTELRTFGRISRKEETTLSTLSDPQALKFCLKGGKHFVTEPSLIRKLKWGRIHCSSIQDIIIGCNHKKCAFSSFSEFFIYQNCYVCPCNSELSPNHKPFFTDTGGHDIHSQSERQASNAKLSHLALKQLALVTVRQHYCRRWIAITATHELPAIWAGFTLITGGNAAWHLCDSTHFPSGLLGHATSKNQQKPVEMLVVEKT